MQGHDKAYDSDSIFWTQYETEGKILNTCSDNRALNAVKRIISLDKPESRFRLNGKRNFRGEN